MNSAARRSGGLFEGLYKVLMRRNSVYVTFVIAGAFIGERVRVPISPYVFVCFTYILISFPATSFDSSYIHTADCV